MADLFDNPKVPRPAYKPPGWVVSELVNRYGMSRATVEKWGARQAFAVLHRAREGADPKAKAAKRRKDAAHRLTELAADDDAIPGDLHDLLCEAFASLDRPQLVELCLVTAALLAPPGGVP